MRLRAFDDDPYLDAVPFPNNIIRVEIKRHHLARVDDLPFNFCEDSPFAIEKCHAGNRDGSGPDIGCCDPSGLAQGDADGAPVDDDCLSLGCAEREKGQQ